VFIVVNWQQRFEEIATPVFSDALKMEPAVGSKTSLQNYQTSRRIILQDPDL
jgi:hypothetical protein